MSFKISFLPQGVAKFSNYSFFGAALYIMQTSYVKKNKLQPLASCIRPAEKLSARLSTDECMWRTINNQPQAVFPAADLENSRQSGFPGTHSHSVHRRRRCRTTLEARESIKISLDGVYILRLTCASKQNEYPSARPRATAIQSKAWPIEAKMRENGKWAPESVLFSARCVAARAFGKHESKSRLKAAGE